MEESGGLQSMGSLRVRHDWATSLSIFMHWRKKWQPTPVFLPGESQGRGSLVGCRLWGRTESDTTEWLNFHFSCIGERNGNTLQCSCLENPRDGGAWWAAIYGVSQSQTRLKWLSSSSILIFTGSQKQPLTDIENNSNSKRFTRHQAKHIIIFCWQDRSQNLKGSICWLVLFLTKGKLVWVWLVHSERGPSANIWRHNTLIPKVLE